MSKVENVVKNFKEIHPNDIILIKFGAFYHVYGRDSYIVSYLFDYQINKTQANYSTCGFPVSSINKVLTKLEQIPINYMVIDKSENYEVTQKEDFKKKNKYSSIFNEAHGYIGKKNRIDNINRFLIESITDEKINEKIAKIEEIIYETR